MAGLRNVEGRMGEDASTSCAVPSRRWECTIRVVLWSQRVTGVVECSDLRRSASEPGEHYCCRRGWPPSIPVPSSCTWFSE